MREAVESGLYLLVVMGDVEALEVLDVLDVMYR